MYVVKMGQYAPHSNRKDNRKMIKIDHLVKNYGKNCAVDDISFEIETGEIVDGFARRRMVEPLCRHCGYARRFSK